MDPIKHRNAVNFVLSELCLSGKVTPKVALVTVTGENVADRQTGRLLNPLRIRARGKHVHM